MATMLTPTDPRARVIYLSPDDTDETRFAIFLGADGKLRIARVPELDESSLWEAVITTLTQLTNLAVQTKKPRLRPSLEAAARAIVENYWEDRAQAPADEALHAFGAA
ncbi:MAG: hypothetical protein ACLPYS_15050 [Vulcanimicrobiaceae bacterium]